MSYLVDVKIYTGKRSLIAWRAEYESVFHAVEDAQKRAEEGKHEVVGLSALRVPENAQSDDSGAWTCGSCRRVNPGWLRACDNCGRGR